MDLDIASPRRGGIIKFVLLAITTKAVAFVSAMEIGGGRRPINWGPRYEHQKPQGGVTFQGPNGGDIRVRW